MGDALNAMRRNLNLAGVGADGIVVGSTALDLAAKLALCSIAEDVRAIREALSVADEPERGRG